MSRSNQVFTVANKASESPRFRMMKHQVRMEVAVKTGMKTIGVGRILSDLMKRANEKESVDFIDINGDPFDTLNFPEPDKFEERLAVETIDNRGNTKITLGFFMISTANMQRIKLSIGFNWLTQQQIYLRIQRMPFEHGTDLFLMGYATMIHPLVANPSEVEADIRLKWYSSVDRLAAEHDPQEHDKQFLDNLNRLQEAQVIINDVLQIPISVERTVIKVECPGKKSFEVPIYQVYVPRRFRDAATYLNDRAILETQSLKNLIPFAISKNDPASFYPQMFAHAKFLHDHRSIIIKSVPPSEFASVKSIKPIDQDSANSVTLKTALRSNTKMITAVHEHPENRSITVSTTATDLPNLLPWITSILPLYPYRPLCTVNDHRNLTPTNDNSNRMGKYAKIFSPTVETDSTTADDSFDPSTISFKRTPTTSNNAWANGPPLNVTFDREASPVTFKPPATRTTNPSTTNNLSTSTLRTYSQYGQQQRDSSTRLREYDDDDEDDDDSDSTPLTRPSATMSDITELVAQAIATERGALDRRLFELERKQQEFLETTAKLEDKLNDMRKQIVDATVKGTISVLTGATSPFATKEDAQVQREENANEFQSIKEGLMSTNQGMALLQQHMTLLLQRTETLFSSGHDPDIASPPRKSRAISHNQADSHMSDMEGDGDD